MNVQGDRELPNFHPKPCGNPQSALNFVKRREERERHGTLG